MMSALNPSPSGGHTRGTNIEVDLDSFRDSRGMAHFSSPSRLRHVCHWKKPRPLHAQQSARGLIGDDVTVTVGVHASLVVKQLLAEPRVPATLALS